MEPPDPEKARLRVASRTRRDALAGAERAAAALRLADHGMQALRERVRASDVVSAYWPMRSEMDPRPLARALAACGATLALPAFVGGRMLFRVWSHDEVLVPAGFGTHEPPPSAAAVSPTLVLAPLLAFDRRGGRLGWGKGYYDRALAELDAAAVAGRGRRPLVVGIAFACQEVEQVPMSAHDRPLDAVVTEDGFWRC